MGLLPGERQPNSSLRLERDSGTRTFGVLGEYGFLRFVRNPAPRAKGGTKSVPLNIPLPNCPMNARLNSATFCCITKLFS
jgi:hypothetical protein